MKHAVHALAALVAAASVLGASAAHARSVPPSALHIRSDATLRQLPAPMRLAFVRDQVARQAAQRSARHPLANLDVTPPVVAAFNLPKSFDPAKLDAEWAVDLTLTDDKSGLQWVEVQYTGPGGQTLAFSSSDFYGETNSKRRFGYQPGRGIVPGTWQVSAVFGADVAGNYFSYDINQLAALGGNVRTKVKNTAYDATAPVLTAAKMSATSLSLSKPWPGTSGGSPMLSAALSVTDGGDTQVSGTSYAWVTLCLLDQSSCFGLYGPGDSHAAQSTVLAGTSLSGSQPTGDYHVYDVYLVDNVGNTADYLSTEFGGDVDMSTLFDANVVSVRP